MEDLDLSKFKSEKKDKDPKMKKDKDILEKFKEKKLKDKLKDKTKKKDKDKLKEKLKFKEKDKLKQKLEKLEKETKFKTKKDKDKDKKMKGKDKEMKEKAKKGRPGNRSKRAGLIFPVVRVHKELKSLLPHKTRSNPTAAVYMTAVMEYVMAELLEIAGNTAKQNGRHRINPRHLVLSIRSDDELNKLIKATIAGGGVVPDSRTQTAQTMGGAGADKTPLGEIDYNAVAGLETQMAGEESGVMTGAAGISQKKKGKKMSAQVQQEQLIQALAEQQRQQKMIQQRMQLEMGALGVSEMKGKKGAKKGKQQMGAM